MIAVWLSFAKYHKMLRNIHKLSKGLLSQLVLGQDFDFLCQNSMVTVESLIVFVFMMYF